MLQIKPQESVVDGYSTTPGSDTTPVPLEPEWSQKWDDKSGNFTYKLDWAMPDDANVQRAVGSFEVLVDLIAPDNTRETLFSTIYHTNVRISHSIPHK